MMQNYVPVEPVRVITNAVQQRVWQSSAELFGDCRVSEIPSLSLDRAEGTFLVDFFFCFLEGGSMLVASV